MKATCKFPLSFSEKSRWKPVGGGSDRSHRTFWTKRLSVRYPTVGVEVKWKPMANLNTNQLTPKEASANQLMGTNPKRTKPRQPSKHQIQRVLCHIYGFVNDTFRKSANMRYLDHLGKETSANQLMGTNPKRTKPRQPNKRKRTETSGSNMDPCSHPARHTLHFFPWWLSLYCSGGPKSAHFCWAGH